MSMKKHKRKGLKYFLTLTVTASFVVYLVSQLDIIFNKSVTYDPRQVALHVLDGDFPWIFAAIAFVFAVGLLLINWVPAVRPEEGDAPEPVTSGNAHWAQPEEYAQVARVRAAEDAEGIILGQLTKDGTQCIDFDPERINRHILCIGATGSGKSTTFVEPYICQAAKAGRSLVITDPKGELYRSMAGFLEDDGYLIRRIDLISMKKSDGWDCLKCLRDLKDDELETTAEIYAQTVVSNIERSKEDSIFARGSAALLKALLLYVVLSGDIPYEKKNLAAVNELLLQDGIDFYDQLFGRNAPAGLAPAVKAYRAFKNASPNLSGNIISHLATGMQVLNTKLVERILCQDDIDLELPGKQKCAYFCRFSATNNTFRFVSAMFFSMLFVNLIGLAEKQKGKCLSVPVDFVMDEFGSIGQINSWLELMSTMRSYGITAVMIAQGMSQLEDIYGKDAIMIQGNCGTTINMGSNDHTTAAWFEKRLGVTRVGVADNAVQTARNHKGVKENLMSVSDIYQMPEEDMLIVFQHCPPIYAHKFHISRHPFYPELRTVSDEDIPDIDDEEGRYRKRAAEERRLCSFRNLSEDGRREERLGDRLRSVEPEELFGGRRDR